MAAALLKDDAEVVVHEPALTALAEHVAEHLLGAVQVTNLECRYAVGKSRRERRREILC